MAVNIRIYDHYTVRYVYTVMVRSSFERTLDGNDLTIRYQSTLSPFIFER